MSSGRLRENGRGRDFEHKPRIVVFGVGGAGGNAVANMVATKLEGVDFVVANTDAQALARHKPEHRFQLGLGITEGLGAGARPEVGRRAAEECAKEISERVARAHMVFITAGMGGGTGTGAAPVIARLAREAGALVVAVVTKPFEFEGGKRLRIAEEGIRELEREVDTLIVIPNQNLFRLADERTSISEAFAMADEVLHSGVRGVTDLMTRPGIVNLDFADVRTVMSEMGKAVMGCGEGEGPRRAAEAAQRAIATPLLDDLSLRGAKAAIINITGGPGLTLYDVDEAANAIRADLEPEANIIVGSAIDESLGERIRVSVVATGIQPGAAARLRHTARPMTSERPGAGGFTFDVEPRDGRLDAPDDPFEPDADGEADGDLRPEATALGVIAALGAKAAERDASGQRPAANGHARDEDEAPGRGGFSFFGRRRRPVEAEAAASAQDGDDDLDIPAFLRRQAN